MWISELVGGVFKAFGFHMYDGKGNDITDTLMILNPLMSFAAWGLALAQIPFIINLFLSIKGGKKVTSDNPWQATTLEWATPTPPGHGNFLEDPVVYRQPYEYSVPGAETDYTPSWLPEGAKVEDKLTHAKH
jgi:cytochrome c oxidase subunit 1